MSDNQTCSKVTKMDYLVVFLMILLVIELWLIFYSIITPEAKETTLYISNYY